MTIGTYRVEIMWQEHIEQGKKALNLQQLVAAEASFRDALDFASRNFSHTDSRIPETFAYLGRSLLLQKKVKEAVPALRQATRIAESFKFRSAEIALADYLWAYIDHTDPKVEERRNLKLKALEQFMQPAVIEKLNRELQKLFTVASAQDIQSKQEPKAKAPAKPSAPAAESKVSREVSEDKLQTNAVHSAPISPDRYKQWAERLHHGIERAKSYFIAEIVAGYLELHQLMAETIQLYPPPHVALADHLLAMGKIAHTIGLSETALALFELSHSNYRKAVGENNVKTAYAQMHLAEMYLDLDLYEQAGLHYHLALNVLSADKNLDKKWLAEITSSFSLMFAKQKLEEQFLSGMDKLNKLVRASEYEEANLLAEELFQKLISVFPADHIHFVELYRRHSLILASSGRSVECAVMSRMANYLDAKISDRQNYQKAINETLPEFSAAILSALYSQ